MPAPSVAQARSRAKLKAIRPLAPAPARRNPAPEVAATSTHRIVESITTAIVERRLMPGTKLAETQIGDIFKVSRTVVRQALNQLSRDRLITLTPARGAFVAQPGVEEARQVFGARRLIEVAMVRELCASITQAQVQTLRRHLRLEDEAVKRQDVAPRTRLLADFHVVLAQLLGNEVLAQLLSDLLSRSSLIALMYQSSHSAEQSHADHVAIVDALERRELRAATRLMLTHLEHVEHTLRMQPGAGELSQALTPTPP
jgi:DNA-binding GntR family transcriptional regulator